MKLSFDKVALLFIPYLLLLSICYDNGYWSMFSISVFSYYEAQDLLKDIAGPIFKFGGLIAVPLLLSFMVILTWASKQELAIVTDTKVEEVPLEQATEILQEQSSIKKEPAITSDNQLTTTKKKVWQFALRKIIGVIKDVALIVGAIAVFVVVVTAITATFFPFEEEGSFLLKYISCLEDGAQIRFVYATLGSAMIIGLILRSAADFDKKEEAKGAVLAFSFVFTFFIAYHYGRVEAYKTVAGTEFRYWIDENGIGYKYLAKINKHYIFSKDVDFINTKAKQDYLLDTLDFNPAIKIITDDSLKSVDLDYYGPKTRYISGDFEKAFNSRNGGKLPLK